MPRWKMPTKEETRTLRRELATRARSGTLRFPDAVGEIRKSLGMTQEQFGTMLGMSRRQVAEIESGRANPTLETLLKIGKLFGFTVGYIPEEAADEHSVAKQ
ncbi:helix-turn-helix transcriptional regulator [Pelagibacterium luteolum]|uniref:DNA-binding transcriptional regulator, XRE-family HTH domain n=1 Tax=Pelagibacterium luteolum TaxID=440168 RepID=A0A1G8A017_9HYPH|nr:helix-turn-helix transcriptional regulator [Pelagibacterium luteolum]SDH14243.1 DNA-binding transcriptional regulator, XRE-family HTH domain [Pelagibacterium luteolum]